jgi:ATP-dependent helicase/nuclease subunit A
MGRRLEAPVSAAATPGGPRLDRPGEETARARATRLQREASDPAHSAWVSASAGTGKTTVLVKRVLRLLLEGVAPHRILCITYTKAAAAEMAIRIDRELMGWATMAEADLEAELAELMGTPPDRARCRRARRLFHGVLEAPGGLQIATIHAFCQEVLKRFPIEAGIAPHFAVIDERDAAAARADARRATIEAALDGDGALATIAASTSEEGFGKLLSEAMDEPGRLRRAIGRDFGAFEARVHAELGIDPGTNESNVVAAAALLDAGCAAALSRVADAMLRGGKKDRAAGEAIAAWLAAPDRRSAQFYRYLTVFFTDEGAGARRVKLIHKDALKLAPDGAEVLSREAERLDRARDRIRAARTAAATIALFRLAGDVLERYEAFKRGRAALDFDDLIEKTRALLDSEAAGVAWVLYKLDGGLDHIMIDEAQDTSPGQWALIAKLVEEILAGKGRETGAIERTLFVVGDFKQSIYSFQGAAPEQFEAMHRDFKARSGALRRRLGDVALDVSFRSVRAILETVDRIFAEPAAASGVAPDAGEPIRHLTARAGLGGVVEIWPIASRGEAEPAAPWAAPRVVEEAPHPDARLAATIADHIAGWIRSEEPLESHGRPIRAGDVMILMRRRGELMARMVAELKQRGVPVAGVDRMRLGEQLAVEDLTALGRFLLQPEDDLTLATVLKGPFFGLTDDAHLFPLAHGRGGLSLWRRLGEAAREAGGDFAAAHRRLLSLLDRADFVPPFELYARLVEAEGGRRALLGRLGRDAEDALDEFLELALDYQRRHAPSLEGFLDWLGRGEVEIKRDLEQAGRDEVRVMTVHGAKGLEAPIVFLADTASRPENADRILWGAAGKDAPLWSPAKADEVGPLELRRRAFDAAHAAEQRRLLYVALTRAADRLYLCGFAGKPAAAAGSWHDLAASALKKLPDAAFRFDFAADFAGEGWRIEQHGAPRQPTAPPWGREAEPGPLPDWALRAPRPEPAPPRPLAPSRGPDEPPIASPFLDAAAERFRRGLIVHRLLQTLPDLPPGGRQAAAARFLARKVHGLAPAAQQAIAAETLALLDEPALAPLFGPGSLAEVPIAGTVEGHVVAGQIDRLVLAEREIWIVDYKTNRAPPPTPGEIAPAYLRQMALYRALVGRLYSGRRLRCCLLWTDGPRLMEVPETMLDSVSSSTL